MAYFYSAPMAWNLTAVDKIPNLNAQCSAN